MHTLQVQQSCSLQARGLLKTTDALTAPPGGVPSSPLFRGYMAPEYATRGQLTDKADVYSFGVLLLEAISGRKNIDFEAPPGRVYLLEWVSEIQGHGNRIPLPCVLFDISPFRLID